MHVIITNSSSIVIFVDRDLVLLYWVRHLRL